MLASMPLYAGNGEVADDGKPEYGYDLTNFASKPKFGAYFIGTYKYNDKDGSHGGPGFGLRYVRAYVDGTILGDFSYRVQVELAGTPHVKDYYIEWKRFPEFKVKLGQFKRAFTFENPMNPWDVGTGDFSLAVKKMAGFGDRVGEATMGGRDQGIQFSGDLFPVGEDGHKFFHYQLGIYNGQGINHTDANSSKDYIGTVQFQPIKDLYVGVFGWTGKWNDGTADRDRKRYSVGAKYEHDNWSARAEYIHSYDYSAALGRNSLGDAFYATVGVPVAKWFKVYVKYDQYNEAGFGGDIVQTVSSIAPNFRLHKNLNFQIEYRYNSTKVSGMDGVGYNELWLQYYVRF